MEWITKYIDEAVFLTALGFLARKIIDFYFNAKLEKQKIESTITVEHEKHDISKKQYVFQTSVNKKHEVYPELHRLAYETWNELLRFGRRYDSELFMAEKSLDLIAFDSEGRIIKKNVDQESLMARIEIESRFLEMLQIPQNKLRETNEYFKKNEIYLSKHISEAYMEVIQALNHCIWECFSSYKMKHKSDDEFWKFRFEEFFDEREIFKITEDIIHTLKDTISKELSHVHFEQSEQKEEALS